MTRGRHRRGPYTRPMPDRRRPDSKREHQPAPSESERSKEWGGLARHAARRGTEDIAAAERDGGATADEARSRDRSDSEDDPDLIAAHAERRARRQARREQLQKEARAAIERSERSGAKAAPDARQRAPLRRTRRRDPEDAFIAALGRRQGAKAFATLVDASQAIDEERYHDARNALDALSKKAREVPETHELLGISYYRLKRWNEAIRHLELFRELAGSAEEHPVLADSYRAVGRFADVEALWDELREASPSGDIVTEGRIVTASARADAGDLSGAISLLEKGWKRPKRPRDHHLRRAYALADLYERSGAVGRARELFGWVASGAPDFGDAAQRAGP